MKPASVLTSTPDPPQPQLHRPNCDHPLTYRETVFSGVNPPGAVGPIRVPWVRELRVPAPDAASANHTINQMAQTVWRRFETLPDWR